MCRSGLPGNSLSVADLLRSPPLSHPVGHELAQHRIAHQLVATGPGPAADSQPLRGERPVLPANPGPRLRRGSRLTVAGPRPSSAAIPATPSPPDRVDAGPR